MINDDQGHQVAKITTAMCQEHFYWESMYCDIAKYVCECQ